ncbi:MAG: preprotein translocase subunit YajC [Treponema sp.]|jgi:preprotein translocase subunit YajC|nr:preprotein translocase subunit YajC [Treponema sp.]
MTSLVFSLLAATPDASAGGGGPASLVSTFVPLILIFGIFYFLIIRPQNKKQKDTQRMLESLKKGDKVVTIGGVHGVIQGVKDGSVIVKVDDFTKIEFNRSAIAGVENLAKDDKTGKRGDKTGKIEDKTEEKTETAAIKTGEPVEEAKNKASLHL